ncbi:MAG: isoleucine--tRNA ligase [Paracoccaceae bacterium]
MSDTTRPEQDTAPDYRDTLFLPKTDFPMRAGLPKREPAWLERWDRLGVYRRLRETAEGREPFALHDGPPYANGHLHIGHALNKILKDFVVRSQQMMGRDSRYVPGWDCHGLPIEWKIEEQYRAKGRSKDQVPVNELRRQCREFAESWIGVQVAEFKRLGITGDWENPYLTMSFEAEATIAAEFHRFVMNGSLYLGSKPVMWSPIEKTALAEAEVEYREKQSFTIWVTFRVLLDKAAPAIEAGGRGHAEALSDLDGAHVVIWTTTPWTIPSNRGVVFREDIDYGLYEVTGRPEECWARIGDRYLLADARAAEVMRSARLEEGMYRRLRGVSADELSRLSLAHPFHGAEGARGEWDAPRDFRHAPFVTDEEGTGFVHCAPSHGMEEFELYRDAGMLGEVITYNVLEDGTFRPDLPFFGNRSLLDAKGGEGDANKAVIDKLVETGALLARGRIKHSYPHSWRSKAPLIFRNTDQWFVAIDKPLDDGLGEHGDTIRERALKSIDELVTWTPRAGRNRLHSMVEHRPDWVLSRQRAWGVPLACFMRRRADGTVEVLRDEDVNARIVEAFRAEGADAWYEDGAKDRFLAGRDDAGQWEKVDDILDVWFDSGSTHAFVLRDREDGVWPADVYLEGTDQHRGWFHSSLLQACGTRGRAPYKAVVTHGFTLDPKGNKMSKSLGNVVAPEDVTKQYGADILRLWVAQADYTADLRIGEEILKGTADSYRRLRNGFRFMLGALGDYDAHHEAVAYEDMPLLERWVLHRLAELDDEVRRGYAAFDYQAVFQKLFNFVTADLSAFYFDVRKDALYCDGAGSLRRRAARTAMDALFNRLTTWLAPILVFTMEEVWLDRFPGETSSVHLVDFPATPASWRDDALAARWEKVRAARRVVTGALEEARRSKTIGASLEAAPALYVAEPAVAEALSPEAGADGKEGIDMAELCITSGLDLRREAPPEDAFRLDHPEIGVVFRRAEGAKCARCWQVLPDVGRHAHPETCARCDAVLAGR